MSSRSAVLMVACGALVVTIAMGVRQAFGIFLQPLSADLAIGREVFSLAIALQNLMLGLPLMGIVADRYGARRVVIFGGILYAIGLALVPFLDAYTGLYLFFGVLVGLGLSSTTYVVILGAIARAVPPERRTGAFGVTTAAGSFGMFAMVPLAQWLLSSQGWQSSFLILAALTGSIALLGFLMPSDSPALQAAGAAGQPSEGLLPTIMRAQQHSGYWLLNLGFFVCGFHVAFIATHLPAFLSDRNIAPAAGATALALIGLFNIFGSYLFGRLGDRYRKKYLLGFLYLARAVVIGLFLLLPMSNLSAMLFGAAIGFLWLATVPLTSGMVAQIFGSRYLSTLYGFVFLCHQVGSFLGVWLAGRLYDTTGSYDIVWMLAIGLGVLAALVHLPISDQPLVRSQPAPVVEPAPGD